MVSSNFAGKLYFGNFIFSKKMAPLNFKTPSTQFKKKRGKLLQKNTAENMEKMDSFRWDESIIPKHCMN